MMQHYETLFVLKPTLTEEEINSQVEKVKGILAKEEAELIATNTMGMRKLAYNVEKNNRGFYTVLYFKAQGTTIAELERNLRNNEDVIKFLTVKYGKAKEIVQFNKLVALTNRSSQPQASQVSEPSESQPQISEPSEIGESEQA